MKPPFRSGGPGSPSRPGFLAPGLALALALAWLSGCSSSFCGAPCEKPPPQAPALVNQYGTVYGHLEIQAMTPPQLQAEKTSLEILLAENGKDAEILKALKEREHASGAFDYNDYSTGGSRFDASGKLRRDASAGDPGRRIPRMISESQNRELFERYRQVKLRQRTLSAQAAAQAEALKAALADSVAAPADTSWTGAYRINGDTLVAAPGPFRDRDACEKWARERADGFRSHAFAFEYECRKGGETISRKIW